MLYRAPFFLCYEKEEGVASLGNGWRVSGVTQKVLKILKIATVVLRNF